MVVVQSQSKRKVSGGRYTNTNPKRKHQIGRRPAMTKLEDANKAKTIRTKGGNHKNSLLNAASANIVDPKTNKAEVVEIEGVVENPANRHFVRRNIITKGTIIETPKGNARVTNRPGQEGTINAALLKE